jgi:hypothetical protein
MRTKEQIVAENKRLKAEYGSLFDEVTEICFRHDPIGINYEDNHDEYEPEARTILPRLKTCQGVGDALRVVHEEFQKWFGPDIAGPNNKYRSLAEEIWNVWNERKSTGQMKSPQA